MPITVNCPNCNRALRVPDELLGKRVKCPACATILTTSVPGAQPSAPPPEGEVVVRRKRPPEPQEEEPVVRRRRPAEPEEEEEEEAPRPARRRPEPADEEEYEEEEPEEEEEEERPRRRRLRFRSSRQRARSAVAAPAIALMVLGGLGITLYGAVLILRLAGVEFFQPANQANVGFQPNAAFKVGGWVGILVPLSWGITVLGGAIQMKTLKSYRDAMTASIVAMLPCNICCLLGIPFGIWALVVINRSDVRSSFG